MTFQERLILAFDRENARRRDAGEPGLRKMDLWKAAGASSGAATHWFNGSNGMSLETCELVAPLLGVSARWLFDESQPMIRGDTRHAERSEVVALESDDIPPAGYIRLEHLPYQPSMGRGRAQVADHVVQHIDVLESFVRQKVGSVSPDRIKILTGVGTSMMPRIKDQDIVFVDIHHRWIDAPGYYVIDVGGLLLLKKAMILANGTLILRSENVEEFPDEERYDLRTAGETITVCGKVLAWWTLMQG